VGREDSDKHLPLPPVETATYIKPLYISCTGTGVPVEQCKVTYFFDKFIA